MICGVYEIWIGDYFYQGSSKDINKRIYQHKQRLEKGDHYNLYMQNVYNKYKSFEWQILVECDDRDVAFKYEADFIEANYGSEKYLNLKKIYPSLSKNACDVTISLDDIKKLCPIKFTITEEEED